MSLRELLQKRGAITVEMRSIADKPSGENGDLSAEQETRFGTLKTELAAVEKQIERQQFIDEAERRIAGNAIDPAGTGDRRLDAALSEFSLRRAILSQVPSHTVDCQRERELCAELARRSAVPIKGIAIPMSVFRRPVEQRDRETRALISTSTGADLVATDHLAGQFIDLLRSSLVSQRLGVRTINGLVGNVEIPKRTGSGTSAWIAEDSALTPTDGAFDKVNMAPKTVGSLSEFTRNMLLQSSPDIEMLTREDMAAVLARAIDLAVIKGGDDANTPDGVMATVEPTTPATASWAHILGLIEQVEIANSLGSSAWLGHPSTRRLLRTTLRDPAATNALMLMEDPTQLANYPFVASTLVPAGASGPEYPLFYGVWSDIIVGYWSTLDVLVNPYESTAYSKGNVQIRSMMTADIAFRHTESFAWFSDMETA
jgi:HK97 family phage major capsid protein